MFSNFSKKSTKLLKYANRVEELRELGRQWNISDNEMDEIFRDAFRYLNEFRSEEEIDKSSQNNQRNSIGLLDYRSNAVIECIAVIFKFVFLVIKVIICIVIVLCLLYFIIACHNPTQKFVTKYIQGLIYPFMRNWRFLTLPLILKNPSLTDWHEEVCLVNNPLFRLPDLDCWPCEGVRSVLDLSGLQNFTEAYYHSGVPFLVKDASPGKVDLVVLNRLFKNHTEELRQGAPHVHSSVPSIATLDDLFSPLGQQLLQDDPAYHITWKVHRVWASRIVRKVFPRPYFVPPNTEVAIQKFIYFDGLQAPPYDFPLTDFANIWVLQGEGERLMVLVPSPECSRLCSPVSVVLRTADTLFFNWQFWRPKSVPLTGSIKSSVTFVGSFY